MTREEALQNLNLPPGADAEVVEKAYQRLVGRYPPEFHPDRFRTIDESYRQLTSLPEMLKKLLSPSVEATKLSPGLLEFEPAIPHSCLEKALEEVRSVSLYAALWKPTSGGKTSRGRRQFGAD